MPAIGKKEQHLGKAITGDPPPCVACGGTRVNSKGKPCVACELREMREYLAKPIVLKPILNMFGDG